MDPSINPINPITSVQSCGILNLPEEILSLQPPAQSISLPPESAIAQQDSPLLQLPSEIRNRIYFLALLPGIPNDHDNVTRNPDQPAYIEVRKTYRTPPLLNTSRQLRSEAGNLYFGSATFILCAERGSAHDFVHRSPCGICLLWLATRAFQGSRRVRRVSLQLYSPVNSTSTGWLEVWKPIALQMVRDRIRELGLGEGIRVEARV